MRSALFVLVLAACGDNTAPPLGAEPRSGARLKLHRYVYPDGTREVDATQFFDAARRETCRPAVWSDGQTYCTPPAAEAVYTSDDCTTLVGRVVETEAAPRYVLRTYTLAEVEHPSRLFIAGEPTPTPPQIWRLRAGVCFGPEPAVPTDRYYAVAAEVTREELVRVKHAPSTAASRLEVTNLLTDDGLQAPGELVDRAIGLPCELDLTAAGGAIPCVPQGSLEARYYADAACSILELEVSHGAPVPPIAWARDEATGCVGFHELGGIIVGPTYRVIAGDCRPVVTPGDATFYRLDRPFEPAMLARAREHRDGRRLLGISAVDGDLTLRDPRLYDTALSTECRRTEVARGEHRCVPVTETPVTTLFSDAACTAELAVALIDTRPCALRAPYAKRSDGDVITFHALGEAHTGPVYFISTGEHCVPFTPGEPRQLYDVGPAITVEELARATLVTDP